MYEKNEIYLNSNKVAVVDYDNDMIALVQFEDGKVDFLQTNYNSRPKVLFKDKTIVFPGTPDDD